MRHLKHLVLPVLVLLAAFGGAAGCAKKDAPASAAPAVANEVALVPAAERSAHFAPVTRHLELGGLLYGYVDIDGDAERLAGALRELMGPVVEQQPMVGAFLPEDFVPFFADLGLTDVKALGFSSVAMGDGVFRNRVFFHLPKGRHGLFAGLGGAEGAFAVADFAPAAADLVYETELDAPAAYAAIRAVVARAAGEPMAEMLDLRLDAAEEGMPLTPREVLAAARGRFSLVLSVDETRSFEASPGLRLPAFDLAFRQEHGGAKVLELLSSLPAARREERAGGVVAFLPAEGGPDLSFLGWKPEVLIDGDALMFVSRPDYLAPAGAKLSADPAFRSALATVGEKGNGLTYVSPRFAERARRLLELNPEMPAEQRLVVGRLLGLLPAPGATLVSVRQNLPDGILFRSQWNSSLKGKLVLANPGVVAGTGLVAAMAIPAFQKVRTTSQEKAVLNNLRQLAAASDQFFLENGVNTCTYADLVGTGPNHYIRELPPVAGEDYTGMIFRNGEPLEVRLRDGRVVRHER